MVSTIHVPTTGEATASFNDMSLSDGTVRALDKMGIVTPTPIQAEAIPVMREGRDMIGQARTGSGKTLAFGIPAIESIDMRVQGVQVLVLTPTRELATQVGGVLEQLAAPKGAKVGLIYGGRALGPQRDMLRKGIQVVVGTPGRVLDLLNQGALWLDRVRFLVLDEADEMLDRGFAPDVERILARTNTGRQTALFSATLPDWVRKTADKHLHEPVTITVDPNPEDVAPVEHVAYDVTNGDKMAALRDLLDHRGEGSIIVFGRTKHGVKKLARQLVQAGYPVGALQGNLSQNARDAVMDDFRSGRVPILFATNVAARGIDVDDVVAVINVELPESPELLTHRIGRTGRMGRKGIAITLLGPEDGAKWRQIERGLGRRIPRAVWRGAEAAYEGAPIEAIAAATAPEPKSTAPRQRQAQPRAAKPAPARSAPPAAPKPTRQQAPKATQPAAAEAPARVARPAFPARTSVEATILSQRRQAPVATERVEPAPAASAKSERSNGARVRAKQLHQVECSACGQPAEVAFQPDPTRPVYCSDCYNARPRRPRRSPAAAAQA